MLFVAHAAAAQTPVAVLGERALAGDARAMVELGLAYREDGHAAVAADWFCRAASQGAADGLFWCGRSLLLGYGRTAESEAGRAMLAAAADAGSADAALLLGEHSDGTAAERWFATAGRLGAAEGDYRLGLLLERRGDRDGALSALRRAAARDFAAAHNALGVALANAADGAPAARRDALDAFIRGARLGDQAAQLNAGLELLAADPARAREYLAQAAAGRDRSIRELAGRLLERAASR